MSFGGQTLKCLPTFLGPGEYVEIKEEGIGKGRKARKRGSCAPTNYYYYIQ